MKKMGYILAVFAVVALIAVSMNASAHKYQQKAYTPGSENVMAAESVTSMSDCMSYSASHKSRGMTSDKQLFTKQFGQPVGKRGGKTTFDYDNYTNIILDCSGPKCHCRCLSKY